MRKGTILSVENKYIYELLEKKELQKSDCERLLELTSFLLKSRHDTSTFQIPLDIFNISGFTMRDIELLQLVTYHLSGKQQRFSFEITDEPVFFDKYSFLQTDSPGQKEKYLIIKNPFGLFYRTQEELNELKNFVSENTGLIKIELNKEGLKKLFENEELIYPIESESDRFIVLTAAINGPTRPRDIKLKGKKTAPSIKNDLNKTAEKKLRLPRTYKLVINDGNGYEVNKKYKIIK